MINIQVWDEQINGCFVVLYPQRISPAILRVTGPYRSPRDLIHSKHGISWTLTTRTGVTTVALRSFVMEMAVQLFFKQYFLSTGSTDQDLTNTEVS